MEGHVIIKIDRESKKVTVESNIPKKGIIQVLLHVIDQTAMELEDITVEEETEEE